ncbi:acetylornithine deacetylase [Marinobacter litoralis]|uniref:acetylornithine deacetylase n=1 Tax=Marinobacter litoralis TaxID=187981 RepID=UPI0018ECFC92|nr:acetylornithine deacetylase [Marinobacter litoralis]MBJ6136653.1 acetylornithine deacetylase [Marinobacter litoralis]
MKRLLSFLVVFSLLAFAGYKAGVWWLADQRLADARTQLSSTGVLERGQIGSALDGRLLLKDASWLDFRLTQPLSMGLVELDAHSPVALVTGLANPQRIAGDWTLVVEQAHMVLEPTMFRNWVTEDVEESSTKAPLVALACAPDPRQHLGSGDLKRMGIDSIGGDFRLTQNRGGLQAELHTLEMGSLELNWPGARLHLSREGVDVSGHEQPADITVRDGGLMRRISAYCSRETGLTVNEWSVTAAKALARALEGRGYQASGQLIALYRQWLTEGGELRFLVNIGSEAYGVPVRDGENPGAAWPVTYNGSQVPDVYLSRIQPAVPEVAPEAYEPVTHPETSLRPQWFAEPVENAGLWQGQTVRVTLSNGKTVEGRLVSVGERELEVARMIAGGEVAYPMLIRAVARFEVWRRGRAN